MHISEPSSIRWNRGVSRLSRLPKKFLLGPSRSIISDTLCHVGCIKATIFPLSSLGYPIVANLSLYLRTFGGNKAARWLKLLSYSTTEFIRFIISNMSKRIRLVLWSSRESQVEWAIGPISNVMPDRDTLGNKETSLSGQNTKLIWEPLDCSMAAICTDKDDKIFLIIETKRIVRKKLVVRFSYNDLYTFWIILYAFFVFVSNLLSIQISRMATY